ncbi:S8/S53 family peptidase [Candidatus Gracilibacteria bacterium]|nr:S8/S53 family peptidase [Candidatus Gracilibacteria bacterium]
MKLLPYVLCGALFSSHAYSLGEEGNDYQNFLDGGSRYLQDIGVDSSDSSAKTVHNNHYYYYNSPAIFAVIDSGVYSYHKDLTYVRDMSGKRHTHGTTVSAIVGATSNTIGYRGIVKPRRLYSILDNHRGSSVKQKSDMVKKVCHLLDIVNMSFLLSFETSYKKTKENFDFESHVQSLSRFRTAFESCPTTLFVLAAGNSDVDAQKENGGIHYRYDSATDSIVYDPLDNVIVVGAHRNTSRPTQNYGKSVDIYAPENVAAAYKYSSSYKSNQLGTSFSAPQVTGVAGLLCKMPSLCNDPEKMKEYILDKADLETLVDSEGHARPLLHAYKIVDKVDLDFRRTNI